MYFQKIYIPLSAIYHKGLNTKQAKTWTKDVFNILSRQEQDEKDCLGCRHSGSGCRSENNAASFDRF